MKQRLSRWGEDPAGCWGLSTPLRSWGRGSALIPVGEQWPPGVSRVDRGLSLEGESSRLFFLSGALCEGREVVTAKSLGCGLPVHLKGRIRDQEPPVPHTVNLGVTLPNTPFLPLGKSPTTVSLRNRPSLHSQPTCLRDFTHPSGPRGEHVAQGWPMRALPLPAQASASQGHSR